ncbi:MAG: MBL fold metallo-hydrolase [Pseudomonadota bacterium]
MAKLTFHGATGQVTGSCYLLQTEAGRVVLECGLFQGNPQTEKQNRRPFPFNPEEIDAVVLSHAHLDHSGRLPKLVKEGFRGKVYLTDATFDLLDLMLKDAAYLEIKDTEWENKRRQRAGKKRVEPLYTLEDVDRILALRHAVAYGDEIDVLPGLQLKFHDAGHILGSAIVEIVIPDKGHHKTLVFSGDLGNCNSPLLRDPAILERADVLLLESTYGDRNHKSLENTLDEFREALASAYQSGGNVIIPSFAVGRAQDLIYWLGKFQRQRALPQSQVFLDSPMAISASKIYARHTGLFNKDDPEFLEIAPQGWRAWLSGLIYSESAEQSMGINQLHGGAIIIAGSGMCTGGRVRHHLKYNLWRREAHLIISGFQAEGTLGRQIIDGAGMVKILGGDVAVKASVHTLGGLSAHAGQRQLLEWTKRFTVRRPRLYLVHGESGPMTALQSKFHERGWKANIPTPGESITI